MPGDPTRVSQATRAMAEISEAALVRVIEFVWPELGNAAGIILTEHTCFPLWGEPDPVTHWLGQIKQFVEEGEAMGDAARPLEGEDPFDDPAVIDRERQAHNLLDQALSLLLDALRETQDEGAMQAIGQVLGQVRRIQARMDGP